LYFKPGVGHLRLVELRDRHLQDLVTAMTQINQPPPDDEKPSEMLRRLIAVRADDTRKMLPGDETRRKKSTKPLSPARIEREFAVIRAALNDAIPSKLLINPFDGVVLPRVDKAKPLVWTPAREARFHDELGRRLALAETAADGEDRVLTTVERQALWAARDLRPVPSMVWMPAHAGEFADYLERTGERLAALFIVAMYTGMRRDELLGLTWSEIDLDQGAAFVRETASGDGPKSEAGIRVVPLSRTAAKALLAWRKIQVADRLAWASDWPGRDRVFTRGRDRSARPVDEHPVRDPRLPRRRAPGAFPRPKARHGQPPEGRRSRHEDHLHHPRPLPQRLHRPAVRLGLPRSRGCGSRRGGRAGAPGGAEKWCEVTPDGVTTAWPYGIHSRRTELPAPGQGSTSDLHFRVFESVRIRSRHVQRRTANAVWE
jgi:integrase